MMLFLTQKMAAVITLNYVVLHKSLAEIVLLYIYVPYVTQGFPAFHIHST